MPTKGSQYCLLLSSFQSDIQAPLNRQIIKSSETVMYAVDMMNNMVSAFMGPALAEKNDLGTTDNRPRSNDDVFGSMGVLGQVLKFASTIYQLS